MDAFYWLILGLIAGGIAKMLTPGRHPSGCIVTVLLGISGALLAGYVGRLAGLYGPGEQGGLIAAILGAVALLVIYGLFDRR